ncbi:MAG: Queuine tRNA-ribosyltransferase [uncultured Solirubrobacteraceae bacterium]|uniref:Queuine tRNA-ribosyltransferase n=1 Tax=uncultured Solirubrobacteraceae bacterium TaxID=1162706 RepID=A0A6J4T3L7_9ACTN|nr:MAG: Queuine tRNA-ribosyltransferase [uncultured Solirubrobacteraceae bacterium]
MAAPCFEITARDPGSRARAGVLTTAHGTVRTPAFVPLATKAVVKGIEAREVEALGFDMVLGNTFHLWLEPGHELIAGFGGLHEFMGWDRPIITDSGGFQVFSMGHGTVADEVKGRSPYGSQRDGGVHDITEEGVTFKNPRNGDTVFMGPETSMEVQAGLSSDIALVFDECTPFHVDRDYTARSTERTHRWLDRCLAWHAEHGPREQLVYGIVQGGVYEDLRSEAAAAVLSRDPDGIAIGGSLGAEKAQMYEVVGWATAQLEGAAETKPRHLLGIGEVDDLIRGVELGIDTFDCVTPTRLGRHGVALIPEPAKRFRVDLTAAKYKASTEPIEDGCPCPACSHGHSRGYLRYLAKNRELTGLRLLTLHNLVYLARLMRDLRDAIAAGTLAETAQALRGGAPPSQDPVEVAVPAR